MIGPSRSIVGMVVDYSLRDLILLGLLFDIEIRRFSSTPPWRPQADSLRGNSWERLLLSVRPKAAKISKSTVCNVRNPS